MKDRITYTNPVYTEYFADPFVWKHQGRYYAVGTGADEAAGAAQGDGTAGPARPSVFPLLHSPNLVHWEYAGRALVALPPEYGDSYWAPEVAFHDGHFYLYYSVGHSDTGHQMRVAVSQEPTGPYVDRGHALIDPGTCAFAIDAHPFRDDDGQWYLFYARDFLDTQNGVRAGTALVVDRLESMTQLAGDERVVLRARHDWQRFMADRPMYDSVYDWHTLEGPSVRKHDGRYYCFYSGGRWENDSYGVDYGVATNVLGPYSCAGGESGARVLRTVPGEVLGPGHNSIVAGPDDGTEYLVYHAWDANMMARRLFIDRLLWTPDGPRCAGPTTTPQQL